MSGKIKVMLVDDSPIALAILKRILSTAEDIEIVGVLLNGLEALKAIPELNPTVICTDLNMPRMNGYELTKAVMEKHPRPILVVSTAVQKEDQDNVFSLLELGALDICPKPKGGIGLNADYNELANELIDKIRKISTISVKSKIFTEEKDNKIVNRPLAAKKVSRYQIIGIGASTGGPQALKTILKKLPVNFPLPIICVLHISKEFQTILMDWLSANCQLKVKIAEPGQKPEPGFVYFPNVDSHLEIDKFGRFTNNRKLPYKGYCPSITVTFSSLADYYGNASIGVLLTGMGTDGVDGIKDIFKKQGFTIGQDEKSSTVYGMVKYAQEQAVLNEITPLSDIALKLMNL